MKISIELTEQEKMSVLQKINEHAAELTDEALKNYFKNISHEDFVTLLRRALRTSCDAFFQHFMQYYIEQKAPEIYKIIHKDILNENTNEN